MLAATNPDPADRASLAELSSHPFLALGSPTAIAEAAASAAAATVDASTSAKWVSSLADAGRRLETFESLALADADWAPANVRRHHLGLASAFASVGRDPEYYYTEVAVMQVTAGGREALCLARAPQGVVQLFGILATDLERLAALAKVVPVLSARTRGVERCTRAFYASDGWVWLEVPFRPRSRLLLEYIEDAEEVGRSFEPGMVAAVTFSVLRACQAAVRAGLTLDRLTVEDVAISAEGGEVTLLSVRAAVARALRA